MTISRFIYHVTPAVIIFLMNSSVSGNTEQTLYVIDTSFITANMNPYYIVDEYALISVNDIPAGVEASAILPDYPGDYYVMLIKSRDDLQQAKNIVPFVVIGDYVIFRSDPETAVDFSSYGWGLTRLAAPIPSGRFASVPGPPVTADYDPRIADLIMDITPQSCESLLTVISGYPTRFCYSQYCRDAEQYVFDKFTGFGLNTTFFEFIWDNRVMRNVIGEMVGTTHPESVIIICAHIDDWSDDPYYNAPGAEDNASGVVAVLEAARILSQYQTELTVRFIIFSAEELGYIGSFYYAENMYNNNVEIGAVINMEMIAYQGPYDYDIYVYSDNISHWLGNLTLETLGYYTNILGIDNYSYNPQMGSDNYYFSYFGYPAIMLIDAILWSGPDWYPYYHTTNDIIDHLNLNLQAEVARTGAALAAVLGRADLPAQDIPTLSQWGMLILGLLLLLYGTVAIIRRRKISAVLT